MSDVAEGGGAIPGVEDGYQDAVASVGPRARSVARPSAHRKPAVKLAAVAPTTAKLEGSASRASSFDQSGAVVRGALGDPRRAIAPIAELVSCCHMPTFKWTAQRGEYR